MSTSRSEKMVVATIIERHDKHVLICLPAGSTEDHRRWEFPTGVRREKESPESAARRVCEERVDVSIDIHTGQPPFVEPHEGEPAQYRFFLAYVETGEGEAVDYGEIRWVQPGQLCEYDFDPVTKNVIDWYVE
jgi:ADP-ribose pyrophosphatase YjhB (NUDIX family)